MDQRRFSSVWLRPNGEADAGSHYDYYSSFFLLFFFLFFLLAEELLDYEASSVHECILIKYLTQFFFFFKLAELFPGNRTE